MRSMEEELRSGLAGRYTVDREIGRGGMATVYLATDLRHKRQIALKVLRPELASSIGTERFSREIEILAQLTHPHILPLHESGSVAGSLFYVMPFVDGESLRSRLERERQLPLDEALRIGEEIADALAHAHGLGIIHRDIKPENILFEAGHAVLADFGIARALSNAGAGKLTDTGWAIGTPAYMSPEQADGDSAVDARADIYALGAVLYEAIGGEPPHLGNSARAILTRALTEPVRPLAALRDAVPPGVDATVRKALARAPIDRFQTATEMREALRTAVLLPEPPARRGRKVAAAVAGIVAAAVVVAIGMSLVLRGPLADQRLGLALFPFQASMAVEDWAEQMPDLLATHLDGTPGLRVADPWALWGGLRPERGARAHSPANVAEAARLARGAGADLFLLGSIRLEPNDSAALAVTIRVYRVAVPDAVETVTLSGSADSAGVLVRRLAVELITRLRPPSQNPVPELHGIVSRSPGAIKWYLTARESLRRGSVDAAVAAIDSALAGDSTFAMGYLEAVKIKSWALFMRGRSFTGLLELLERAERYGTNLSPRNRLRLDAMFASVRTDGPAAVLAVRSILAEDSTDIEAWTNLGYYHTVYGWQYGAGADDAIAALERAAALDSTHVPTLVSLLSLRLHGNDPRTMESADRLRRVDSSSVLARGAMLAVRAVTQPDAGFTAFVDTLVLQDAALLTPVLRSLRNSRPERAAELLDRLRLRQGPGLTDYRFEWLRMLAARGQFQRIDSAQQAGVFDTPLVPAWFQVAPLLAGVGDSVRAVASAGVLAEGMPPDSAGAWFQTRAVWLTGWLVAAYHATFADTSVTVRWRDVIGTFPGGGATTDYRGSLQADLSARMLLRRGLVDSGQAETERAYALWGIHTENLPEVQPEPAMRFQMAMLLLSKGRPDSAAALFRSLVPPVTWKGFLSARAALELGRIHEARNERSLAAGYFGSAYRLWRVADPSLAGWRDAARAGLERNTGEPVSD